MVEDALCVALVLGAVGSVDRIILDVVLDERDVLVDPAGSDVTFVALGDTTEPGGARTVD